MKTIETKRRSLVKALSWRFLAIFILAAVSYAFTSSWKEMSEITIVYTVIQVLLYFGHERLWGKIKWGINKHPLEDIDVNKELAPQDKEVIVDKLKELGYM